MTPSVMFSIVNMIAMPMWLLMIVLPKWKITRYLIDHKIIPIILSFFYVFYIVKSVSEGGGMDFSNLDSVMELFTVENAVLAGWVHYLVFDLLVGMWILDQNKNLGIHHLLIIPCLLASFMMGPVGFLLFIIIRTIKKYTS